MFDLPGYGFGNKGITYDSASVVPGMLYIDLDSKNRDSIYNAYNNGASLIITNKSVSDPLIPIIKVDDIEETYFALLNHLYERPLDKASFIGIYGGSKGKFTAKLLNSIFRNSMAESNRGLETMDYSYRMISDKSHSIAEKLFFYILLCISNDITTIPLVYNNDLIRFQRILKARCDFNIVVDEVLAKGDLAYDMGNVKPLLINIDDPDILNAVKSQNGNIVITYGLNKKAAVTATSIEYGESTKFNYCLQRSFSSKSGLTIEPFELPVSIKGLGINKIYSALAAISCALYYDIDHQCIKEALSQCRDNLRDFTVKKYDSFTLIDSYCITERDYKEAFEMLQMLDYRNLYIITSDLSIDGMASPDVLQSLINEWSSGLNIKEVIIMTENKYNQKQNSLRLLRNTRVSYFSQFLKAINNLMKDLSDKDVLMILGGDDMNFCQAIIEVMLLK